MCNTTAWRKKCSELTSLGCQYYQCGWVTFDQLNNTMNVGLLNCKLRCLADCDWNAFFICSKVTSITISNMRSFPSVWSEVKKAHWTLVRVDRCHQDCQYHHCRGVRCHRMQALTKLAFCDTLQSLCWFLIWFNLIQRQSNIISKLFTLNMICFEPQKGCQVLTSE